MARRVWVANIGVLTVYLAVALVVPSGLTSTMAAISLVGVRARRYAVAAVDNHACLPSSLSFIVTKLTEFRVQTATRNERVSTLFKRVCVSS